ncbi:MAG: response regulator [Chloroflexi bacterium]|nr:response regulator [Chloroflexota bacterium]MBP7043297.1 response regulator [Chloroflexota bacterium]
MTSLLDAYIVVVEDDPNALLVTMDLLRLNGAEHCYASKSVDAALAYAEKLPRVDLFLVDINMPGKSGFEMLEAVRANGRLETAKIIAITAGTFADDVEKARAAGFNGFISKPLRTTIFGSQLQRVLNGEAVWDWR